jgi:hypothetical protein
MTRVRRLSLCVPASCLAIIGVVDARTGQVPQSQVATVYPSVSNPLWRPSPNVVHVYVDTDAASLQGAATSLPRNLVLPDSMQARVASMVRTSPTFRLQCNRVTNAKNLKITVEHAIPSGPVRATTRVIIAPGGEMIAHVQLGPSGDLEELLAHEIEHIVEQLDGVDLRSLANREDTGVWLVGDTDRFETERAVTVGLQVLDEVRHARRRGP